MANTATRRRGLVLGIAFAVVAASGIATHASAVKPIRGIDVIVQKQPGNTATRTVKTDANGVATFGKLEKGQYSVTVVAPKTAKIDSAVATLNSQISLKLEGVTGSRELSTGLASGRSRPLSFETDGAGAVKITVSAEQ